MKSIRNRYLVAFDPGVVTLGLAVFNLKDAKRAKAPKPIFAKAFNMSKGFQGSPFQKALQLAELARDLIERNDRRSENFGFERGVDRVEQVVVETMEFRSNARGVAAIGDVLNVAFSCGVLASLAEYFQASFKPAPVSQWKGQLSKTQVANRILKKWGGDAPEFLSDHRYPSHDWDAVGVGLWSMGHFN